MLQRINLNKSFRPYYINYEDYVKRFFKNSFESFQRYTKKGLKIQILSEVALLQVVRKRVSFKIARTKINQNFLASKYDIKQHSDAINYTFLAHSIKSLTDRANLKKWLGLRFTKIRKQPVIGERKCRLCLADVRGGEMNA